MSAAEVDVSGVTIRNPLMYANNDGIHFTTKGQLAFGAVLAGLLPAP